MSDQESGNSGEVGDGEGPKAKVGTTKMPMPAALGMVLPFVLAESVDDLVVPKARSDREEREGKERRRRRRKSDLSKKEERRRKKQRRRKSK